MEVRLGLGLGWDGYLCYQLQNSSGWFKIVGSVNPTISRINWKNEKGSVGRNELVSSKDPKISRPNGHDSDRTKAIKPGLTCVKVFRTAYLSLQWRNL